MNCLFCNLENSLCKCAEVRKPLEDRAEINRKEVVSAIGKKFSLRKVSFSCLGYGEAYSLEIEGGASLRSVYFGETYERIKDDLKNAKKISNLFKYKGLPII